MNYVVSNNMTYQQNSPKITIGLPVYNGDRFISKRIENILDQTFSDFELLISDNDSTDNTGKICQNYSFHDKRIKYVRQVENMGMIWNWHYVLKNAFGEYFVWASVDDLWKQNFLEKNINILNNKNECVGSTGKVTQHGIEKLNRMEKVKNNFIKKFKLHTYGSHAVSGTYEHKIRVFLEKNSAQSLFGVFRTKYLRKSWIDEPMLGRDLAIILNLLKYGDFYVVDEILMSCYMGGTTSKGIRNTLKFWNQKKIGKIFPYYPFTCWILKNLGRKLFVRNLDKILKMNIVGVLAIMYDIIIRKN